MLGPLSVVILLLATISFALGARLMLRAADKRPLCPHCGQPNRAQARYCAQCGEYLHAAAHIESSGPISNQPLAR